MIKTLMFAKPHRVAWLTLVAAFVIFCIVAVGMVQLVQYVLFDWTTNLETTVHVARGTLVVRSAADPNEHAVSLWRQIDPGDRIRTDELSQGHLTFRDPINSEVVVATVQLIAGSEVSIKQSSRPRFLGDGPFSIRLEDLIGEVEITISPKLERDVRVELRTNDQKVLLNEAGLYRLRGETESLRVTVHRGSALLINQVSQNKLVEAGETGTSGRSVAPYVVEVNTANLVTNSYFLPAGDDQLPTGWGCSDDPDPVLDPETGNPVPQPAGEFAATFFQGRHTVHIKRDADRTLDHSETLCTQIVNHDVSQYDSLRVRATMYLESHSLPGCGERASECVMMLRVRYIDQQGVRRTWLHGFYVHYDENLGWPLRCDTCDQNHEHVNPGTWFVFTSEDLIQDLPPDLQARRPVEIVDVQFDASGHKYEAYIGELSVLASSSAAEVASNDVVTE
ncbi:MAG: hypothetical protein GYB66_00815 [Chloroflexi bacterium]|nr:hypothetical protein [Chloroflexota bacterium]